MDKDEIIKQLQEVIAQLKHENELLQVRIRELEAQLAKYENPHTPPSLRRGGNAKNNQKKNG
ncbi:MAG: IS66 family transposase, partial [Halobacteriota archaeon]|nr:IS66 family transposase [Halobacteriota archaeon]